MAVPGYRCSTSYQQHGRSAGPHGAKGPEFSVLIPFGGTGMPGIQRGDTAQAEKGAFAEGGQVVIGLTTPDPHPLVGDHGEGVRQFVSVVLHGL